MCLLCSSFFCGDHLVLKRGVATCEACVPKRGRLEQRSGVSSEEEERVVALIRADVAATVGPGHDEYIVETAARRRLLVRDPSRYLNEVVDDIQQYLHDTFVDTTWPACPHHPNHPLWFSDGWWRCERSKQPVAKLGTLTSMTSKHGN